MQLIRYHCNPALSKYRATIVHNKVVTICGQVDFELHTEYCFYLLVDNDKSLDATVVAKLEFLLAPLNALLVKESIFEAVDGFSIAFEIGPRLNFKTAYSTNATSALCAAGLRMVKQVERSVRYMITVKNACDVHTVLSNRETIVNSLHDRMVEMEYSRALRVDDFTVKAARQPYFVVDVLSEGVHALMKANETLILGFDSADLNYYFDLFANRLKRNPTNVELFDCAQSNSEHSRHWFFKGRLVVNGLEEPRSLFDMVMDTQQHSNANNVIKFSDNSSGIAGFSCQLMLPTRSDQASAYATIDDCRDIIYTAETHNFPTGVCPFAGATTGTGGRIRDVHATGRGAHVLAGISAYAFGNLHIPGYDLQWEDKKFVYPSNFASPLEIAIQASNGASDYGNKFGEPVIAGFARSFGMRLPCGERFEYVKPIMFSGGLGTIDHAQLLKKPPAPGQLVVKIGGPVYCIGLGGGVASSVAVQGCGGKQDEADYGAVQRGDAEMEQKLNRVIRACVELGANNPITAIHDQGAGGNGNVLKELVEGAGADFYADHFQLGDATVGCLELWGAEYQESNALLMDAHSQEKLKQICARERCPCDVVGTLRDDNKVVLHDFGDTCVEKTVCENYHPFNLNLDCVLGKMPRKIFQLLSVQRSLQPLVLKCNFVDALERVLKLPAVASKRYLTNKVDRSVTGLVAQQQCVGPLHTPLADVAVVALSYFDKTGSAVAVGEQPVKGLVNASAGARMSVGEALTNLVFAPITELKDVKCSANWMWPAKQPGEGAELLTACRAMCNVMQQLGVAVDGGKDSLSMVAKVADDLVKAPGTLVISAYAPCPDISKVVTPDLKCPGGKNGCLLYIRFGDQTNEHRLGGSAVAQCYSQIGSVSPDLDCAQTFAKAFNCTQQCLKAGLIAAGHDVSDGGLITCLLEMAFAGNCGVRIRAQASVDACDFFFAEELGIVLEVAEVNASAVIRAYQDANVPCVVIGLSVLAFGPEAKVDIMYNDEVLLSDDIVALRQLWEETSYQLERLQCNPACVEQERTMLATFIAPAYSLKSHTGVSNGVCASQPSLNGFHISDFAIRVAILREEGSNGDREMAAAFFMAGFEVWDINMQDLLAGNMVLDERFRGVVFVGGFSYADVLGSAKGWASCILFHEKLRQQFERFYCRADTFSLGVCNGCQLMALLGWVGNADKRSTAARVRLLENVSERFESRFSTVRIEVSPALMLRGLEGSVLGVWVAHGEGRFAFHSEEEQQSLEERGLVVLRYVDCRGSPTVAYPENPNGSPAGIAGLCSPDGRHLALMPHPERSFLSWQWPYWPSDSPRPSEADSLHSPWMSMFVNAYKWCSMQMNGTGSH